MQEPLQRLDHIRRWAGVGRALAIFSLLLTFLLAAYALFTLPDRRWAVVIAVGAGAAGLVQAGVLAMLWSAVSVLLKAEGHAYRIYDVIRDVHAAAEQHRQQLQSIAESVQLSDTARSVSHRARERTALRLAINEEILRGDFEAAYSLVELLETRHGYKNEAARLRAEVDRYRAQNLDGQFHEAVSRVTRLIDAHDWDAARREMDRLIAVKPDAPEVRELPRLFARRRGEHKRRLLKEWDESVQRNEVDRGIAILKELDQYLTPNEAAALQESARGVFRAKLHNLGVQFSLAVTEHNWTEALAVGRQIVEEFPNSRMAHEVNERMHVLTRRAQEAAEEPAPA